MTESPFVRTGAVVRCASCQNKYRIKTSHLDRVLTTGPRTLDESDAVLRNDSVDIDPDEIAPVSIDDEGNVVGLSGLSELMRQSDAQGAKDRVQARMHEPPSAASPTPRQQDQEPAIVRLDDGPVPGNSAAQRRARLVARRRRKRLNAIVVAALACLVLVSGGVLTMMIIQSKAEDTNAKNKPSDKSGNTTAQDGDANANNGKDPGPDNATDPEGVPDFGPPSPNPNVKFKPPWTMPDPDALPVDVPTVVTPARRAAHEGWYIMSPPRGSASAAGVPDVEIDDLKPEAGDEGQTVLVGSVLNQTKRVLLHGELHVMLLDGSGRVYAETYTPLVMVDPDGSQDVALPIATRHWERARGVRTAVSVRDWSDALKPMPDVELNPVGRGEHAVLRVSSRNRSGSALRGVLIVIEAADAQGKLLDRFVVENEKLYVSGGDWLDLVVATPLPAGREAAKWSVLVQPR